MGSPGPGARSPVTLAPQATPPSPLTTVQAELRELRALQAAQGASQISPAARCAPVLLLYGTSSEAVTMPASLIAQLLDFNQHLPLACGVSSINDEYLLCIFDKESTQQLWYLFLSPLPLVHACTFIMGSRVQKRVCSLPAWGAMQAGSGPAPALRESHDRASIATGLMILGLGAGLPPRSPARPRQPSPAGAAAAAGPSPDTSQTQQQPSAPGGLPAAAGRAASGAATTPAAHMPAEPPAYGALPLPAAGGDPGQSSGAGAARQRTQPTPCGLPRLRAASGSPNLKPASTATPSAARTPTPAAASALCGADAGADNVAARAAEQQHGRACACTHALVVAKERAGFGRVALAASPTTSLSPGVAGVLEQGEVAPPGAAQVPESDPTEPGQVLAAAGSSRALTGAHLTAGSPQASQPASSTDLLARAGGQLGGLLFADPEPLLLLPRRGSQGAARSGPAALLRSPRGSPGAGRSTGAPRATAGSAAAQRTPVLSAGSGSAAGAAGGRASETARAPARAGSPVRGPAGQRPVLRGAPAGGTAGSSLREAGLTAPRAHPVPAASGWFMPAPAAPGQLLAVDAERWHGRIAVPAGMADGDFDAIGFLTDSGRRGRLFDAGACPRSSHAVVCISCTQNRRTSLATAPVHMPACLHCAF